MSLGRLFLSTCLVSSSLLAGCGEQEPAKETGPIVGVLELPLVHRNAGVAPPGAAKVEISPSEIRVEGETALALEQGKVPPAEASDYLLPKLQAKLAGKSGLAITAHATIPYATLARVIQTAQSAGAKELAFQVRKPGTTKDTGWLTVRQNQTTESAEDGKFAASDQLPWDAFAKAWEESLAACQASSRADCGYSPVAKAVGGQLDMMLRVRGSGMAIRMRQTGAPEVAPKPAAKPKRAEMLDGLKAAAAAPKEEAEPTAEHVFTLRSDQATAVPSPISGIVQPVCGSVTCAVVLEAETISSTLHVLSLLGAAFPDGTPEPKVSWVLPPR